MAENVRRESRAHPSSGAGPAAACDRNITREFCCAWELVNLACEERADVDIARKVCKASVEVLPRAQVEAAEMATRELVWPW
jgi:hypothetical protein